MSSPMTQDKPHTGLRAAALEAAKAEYARWGTGCDTRRPKGYTSWVGRQNDDGSWHEVGACGSEAEAERECRDRALAAALLAAAPAPDKAGDRDGSRLIPHEMTPAMQECIAFNLSEEFGADFVLANQRFAKAVYAEAYAAGAALSTGNEEPRREGARHKSAVEQARARAEEQIGPLKQMVRERVAEERASKQASPAPTLPVSPEPDSRAGVDREKLEEALAVIEFAQTIDDHYDMREFLKGWSEGDTTEWPEFTAFLAERLATPTPDPHPVPAKEGR